MSMRCSPSETPYTGQLESCVVPLSAAMRDMEVFLECVLIVCDGGTRPVVSTQEVAQVIEVEHGVHPIFSENFIVVVDTHATKGCIL